MIIGFHSMIVCYRVSVLVCLWGVVESDYFLPAGTEFRRKLLIVNPIHNYCEWG